MTTTKNNATNIMKNAKNELRNNGFVFDETVKNFCELFECDEDFATEFLNNKRKLTSTGNLKDYFSQL